MLILFDIDGTLTATSECDLRCYAATFQELFGFPLPYLDWHAYRHVTDSGIIGEVLEQRRGSYVTPEELVEFERRFVLKLETEFCRHPEAFREIPGAKALLESLRSVVGLAVALATGGMRASALFKLSKVGIDGQELPAAFANDSFTREGIAKLAILRAGGATDVIYVGDGVWDVNTAASLGLRFIGITQESSSERLQRAGANVWLSDFLDQGAFLRALDTAAAPCAGKAGHS
ncbi:MAG: HAD family hydrolase [Candidatus Hydrogenedentes bacterium]|nr:HAD family hydrolase [Candidatus Hydrogenedentota bacterium]